MHFNDGIVEFGFDCKARKLSDIYNGVLLFFVYCSGDSPARREGVLIFIGVKMGYIFLFFAVWAYLRKGEKCMSLINKRELKISFLLFSFCFMSVLYLLTFSS